MILTPRAISGDILSLSLSGSLHTSCSLGLIKPHQIRSLTYCNQIRYQAKYLMPMPKARRSLTDLLNAYGHTGSYPLTLSVDEPSRRACEQVRIYTEVHGDDHGSSCICTSLRLWIRTEKLTNPVRSTTKRQ